MNVDFLLGRLCSYFSAPDNRQGEKGLKTLLLNGQYQEMVILTIPSKDDKLHILNGQYHKMVLMTNYIRWTIS